MNNAMDQREKKFRQWRRWLRRIRDEQVRQLATSLVIFRLFQDSVKRGHVPAGTVRHGLADWIASGYAAFAASGVRRVTEGRPVSKKWRSLTLLQFLEDVKQHANLITVEATRRRLRRRGIKEREARRLVSEIARGQKTASHSAISRDITSLKTATTRVKRFVDKQVAHTEWDRRKTRTTSFGELKHAIETIQAVWSRWSLALLGQTELVSLPEEGHAHFSELFDRLWRPRERVGQADGPNQS
jgi:hypothetical protein